MALRGWRFMVCAAWLGLAWGCDDPPGTGAVGQICNSDAQCFNGFTCDLDRGICEPSADAGGEEDDAGNATEDAIGEDEPCVGPQCQDPCHPTCGASEQCIDGECVCLEGQTRPCGSKLGECLYGQQLCQGLQWGACEGGVQPQDELCDHRDNDCDGIIDENVREVFYRDRDEDSFGDEGITLEGCEIDEGFTRQPGDCDDADPAINPEALEVCDGDDEDCDGQIDQVDPDLSLDEEVDCLDQGVCSGAGVVCSGALGWQCAYPPGEHEPEQELSCDGLDNDCDGLTDEGLTETWYLDGDGDSFGASDSATLACAAPSPRHVQRDGDCDDGDEARHPGADEVCDGIDNDCDDQIDGADPGLAEATITCEGRGVCAGTEPSCLGPRGWACLVTHPAYEPEGETLCDGLDNDCDGQTDEDLSRACGTNTGVCTRGVEICQGGVFGACSGRTGIAPTDDESRVDLCDGLDNDCDGRADEGCVCRDGDRLPCGTDQGACAIGAQICASGEYGACDGQGPVPEFCDPGFEDNDCDGLDDIAEGLATAWFEDRDGDGFGAGPRRFRCGPPGPGQSPLNTDCDDANRARNPAAAEVCDGIDNNCNGQIDDDPAPAQISCPQAGICAGTRPRCLGVQGYACLTLDPRFEDPEVTCDSLDNDCDAATDEGLLNACGRCGAVPIEACDGIDNDCDGQTDETFTGQGQACSTGRPGVCATGVRRCVLGAEVCAGAQPSAEVCDNLDNDCDAATDEGLTRACSSVCGQGVETCQRGAFGACSAPQPSAEVCDGLDNDCDGGADEGLLNACGECGPVAAEVCDGLDNNCNGQVDEGLRQTFYADRDRDGFGAGPVQSRCGALQPGQSPLNTDCDDTQPSVHPGAAEVCANGLDEDCDGQIDEGCQQCNRNIDADFDGSNQCDDCDDTNGGILPGAPERCDGVDNDCDGLIDEDFDRDGDNFSICARDPLLLDCDDLAPAVNPGRPESCGGDGRGNGIDDNCNGYVDEGCAPCDPNDTDGDGVSQCQGDCDPDDGAISPLAEEICDGLDNDCNLFTVQNCAVSDPCNHDGNLNFGDDPDLCGEDLICGQLINRAGQPSGEFICTALCNTSETGPLGDGCAQNETCFYDLLRSANVHGCARTTDPPGALRGGAVCSGDEQCRSNRCERVFTGPNGRICLDYCGSDAYCQAPGVVCRILQPGLDGRCWPSSALGAGLVGATCTTDAQCDHGLCADLGGARRCTEACCADGDCPNGFTCSLAGQQAATGFALPDPDAPACISNADCPGAMVCTTGRQCARALTDTSPMCVADLQGQGSRQAGAACNRSDQCRSNFCADDLGVCVEPCCNDNGCPSGLTCELQTVETLPDQVTSARVCINLSTDSVILRQ